MEDSMKGLVLTAALVAMSASARAQPPAPPAPEQDCLRIGQVYDFQQVPGNRSLIVTDRARHRYKMTFMGACYDLQFNLGLGFKSHGSGRLSCITKGDEVIANDPAIPFHTCPIQKVEAYTPAMEQADAAAAAAAKVK
jgi:Family of unknown function (DUF6491)